MFKVHVFLIASTSFFLKITRALVGLFFLDTINFLSMQDTAFWGTCLNTFRAQLLSSSLDYCLGRWGDIFLYLVRLPHILYLLSQILFLIRHHFSLVQRAWRLQYLFYLTLLWLEQLTTKINLLIQLAYSPIRLFAEWSFPFQPFIWLLLIDQVILFVFVS